MKLKNIWITALMVWVCAGCSNDKNEIPFDKLPDAKLSVSLKVSGPAGFRATGDVNALPGEMNVNNLAAVVFDASGSNLLGDPVWQKDPVVDTTDGTLTLLDIPAKTTVARIVILANVPENIFSNLTTYDEFQSRLASLESQHVSSLTMSTQVIVSNADLKKGDNYLGYEAMGNANINGISSPLELTRLASRVELKSLLTNFISSKLEGRTVRVDKVRLLNQKTASHYFSTSYWGAVMADANLGDSESTELNRTVNDETPITETTYRHYVMENSGAEQKTQIEIEATLLASPGFKEETKVFKATVNPDGLANKYDHNYVKRNYIYRLNVTFGPNSFDTEATDPVLDVQVEVVGWGPVDQSVEIE